MKAVSAVIGVGMMVAGVATGNFWLVAQGVAMTASTLLAPKAKQQARQAAETTLSIGEQPRQALLGLVATGGTLTDAFNYGGKNGTDWEVLSIDIADHRCASLEGFYVNDAYVSFAGDGAVSGYGGQLMVWWLPGTESQTLPAVMIDHGGYAASDNGAGIARVIVAYKADPQGDETPIWTAGRPRFLWVVKGKLCYLPRKDSTVAGGSGPHRWDDPATWEWTDNLIDCRYNWVRGIYACDRITQPDMLLVGRGLSAIEAPPERIFAAANLCDEDVPLAAGGSEKRYRVSAAISADEPFDEVEERFAAACGGVIVQPEGGVEIEPGHAKSPVAYITDDDLVVGTTVTFSDYRSEADDEWVNTVIPRYNEPAQKWADHAAPIRRETADVSADGGSREETLTLVYCASGTQAQRCGEIRRRMGRLLRTGGITLGPVHAGIEEGDWIVWTSARRMKGAAVTFRVETYALDNAWRNALALREIAPTVFSWSTADEKASGAVAEQQTPPVYGSPDPDAWAVTAELSAAPGASTAALIIVGAVDDPDASEIIFEYRKISDTPWTDAGSSAPTITRRSIPVETDQTYQVAITYRIRGAVGTRLVKGPVSTSLAGLAPSAPTLLEVSSPASGSVAQSWRNSTSSNFDHVRLHRGPTDDFDDITATSARIYGAPGAEVSRSAALPAGTYFYWIQGFNADDVGSSLLGPVSVTVA